MNLLDLYALTPLGTMNFPTPVEVEKVGSPYDADELRAARAQHHAEWKLA